MYKFNKFLILVFLGFLFPAYTQAQEEPVGQPSLERDFRSQRETLLWSNFRSKVRALLPDYTLQELNQELAELDIDAQYLDGDLVLSANGSYNATIEPDVTTHNFRVVPGLSKKFLPTGTTVAVELDASWRTIDAPTMVENSTLTPKITLTQDLLQNFFGLLHHVSVNDAKRKLEVAKQKRQYAERKLQKAYDEMYLNWILLWRKQAVLQAQLNRSTLSLRNAQEQRRSNYIDNGQYQQFYSAHLLYRSSLQRNEEQLQQMDQRLARFLGQTVYKPDLAILDVLLPQTEGDLPPLEFSNSWDWAISEKSLKRVNILYKYSKLQRLPNLTLSASLAFEKKASRSVAPNGSEQSSNSDWIPTYGVSIQLSWPMFMRKAKHSIKGLELQLKQLETNLKQQQQDFEIRIANQWGSHQFLQENYALQKEAASAMGAIYASNQLKYEQARASLRDLLDAEIRKLSADLDLLQTESNLVKDLLEYSYETQDQDILSN